MSDHEFMITLRTDATQAKKVLAEEAAAIKKRVKDHNDAAKAVGDAAKREAEDRRRVIKVVSDTEKEAARARIAAQKAEVDAARATAKAQADAIKAQKSEMDSVASAGSKFLGVLSAISGVSFGLGAITQVVGLIGDSFERARKQAEEATQFAAGYRETLKEIAALKGESGPTAGVIRADLEFRKQTLQDQAGARATQEGFLNLAQVSIDVTDEKGKVISPGKMTKDQAEKAQVFAGKMHGRLGGSGEAFGSLAGMIPDLLPGKRVDDERISKELSQIFEIGQLGGASAGDFATSMQESGYLAGTGAYGSGEDRIRRLGVMASAISMSTPKKMTHALAEINRMITGGRLDPTGAPGVDEGMSPKKYLTDIGVTDQDDDLTGMMKMTEDLSIQKEKYERENPGKDFPMGDYIKRKGFGNITDINVFKGLVAKKDAIRNRLMPIAGNLPTMKEANRRNEEFAGGIQGMTQAERVDDDRTKIALGMTELEYAKNLGMKAFKTLQARNPIETTGTYEDWKDSRAVRNEMIEIQREELLAKGQKQFARPEQVGGGQYHDPLGYMKGTFFNAEPGSKASADLFAAQGMRIAELGGSPMGRNAPRVKAQQEKTTARLDNSEKVEKLLTTIANNGQPAPIQVAIPGGANQGPVR